MFSLWNFFLSRRQFTYLVIAVLIFGGIISAIAIRKENTPEVQVPFGIVSIALPGASAEEVEKLITNKVEKQLAGLANVDKIVSSSGEGISIIQVQFLASAPIDQSIQKLKDEVDKAKADLPEEAKTPVVSDVNFADQQILVVSVTADLPFAEFAALGKKLKDELEGVSGVSKVSVDGIRKREVSVVVRKEELANYGLSFSDLTNAIKSANISLPAGKITVNDVEYPVRFNGDLVDPSEVGQITIPTASGPTLFLRDIATINDGVEPVSTITRLSQNGNPSEQALTLNIFKSRGRDIAQVVSASQAKLQELKDNGTLEGSTFVTTFNTGKEVTKSLNELTRTGVETVILVMIILVLTIGWRESLVAGVAVPLSFLISFIGLYYSGNTLNFVSLFALILSIGILVDAGIVIVEGMSVRLTRHHDPIRAARETVKEFSWPLIAGTATTIGVFVPLFFISGITGQFIKSIPFTIIAVLIASLIVALGILPLLTTLFVKEAHTGKLAERQEYYAKLAKNKYEAFLRWSFLNKKFQKRFLIGIGVAFIASILLPIFGLVKVEFFPGENAQWVYLNLEMPQGTPLARTDLAMRSIEEILYEHQEFESVVITVGGQNFLSGGTGSGSQFANALIILPEDLSVKSSEVVANLRKETADFTEGTIQIGEPSNGPPTGLPILIKFTGDNLEELGRVAESAANILETVPNVTNVNTSSDSDTTEFVLTVNRAELASLGIPPALIASTLRSSIYGSDATTIRTFGDDIKVTVRANLNPETADPYSAAQATYDSIKQIPIVTKSGQVLLGSVVTPSLAKSSASIAHENKERIVTVSGGLSEGGNARVATAAFTKKIGEEMKLPDGVRMSIGGEDEETNKSFAEMGFAFLAGILLMFAVVVLEFNSFRLAGYTLMIVPLSLIGVMLGLALTFKPLSFPSLLGMIALGGVLINHAIILIDSFLSPLRREHEGGSQTHTLDDFIVTAASSRLRPIFLTTVTAAIGMIPLSFASALWAPLAFTIMFGLVFGTVLTLIFIPLMLHVAPGKDLTEMLKVTDKGDNPIK